MIKLILIVRTLRRMQDPIDSRSLEDDSIPRKSITSDPVTADEGFFDSLIFFSIKRRSLKDMCSSPKKYDFTLCLLTIDDTLNFCSASYQFDLKLSEIISRF